MVSTGETDDKTLINMLVETNSSVTIVLSPDHTHCSSLTAAFEGGRCQWSGDETSVTWPVKMIVERMGEVITVFRQLAQYHTDSHHVVLP